jgi:hypothetical protein
MTLKTNHLKICSIRVRKRLIKKLIIIQLNYKNTKITTLQLQPFFKIISLAFPPDKIKSKKTILSIKTIERPQNKN